MFTITNWTNRPDKITEDNFYKQSFQICKDGEPFLFIESGMCGMSEIEHYFKGEISIGLTITLNNIVGRGVEALKQLKDNNLELWGRELLIKLIPKLL